MTANHNFWIQQRSETDLEDSKGARQVALFEVLLDQPDHVRRLNFDGHRDSLTLSRLWNGTGLIAVRQSDVTDC